MQVQSDREEETHREREANNVVAARPHKIQLYPAEDGPGEMEGGRDIEEGLRPHQNDIGGLHGDVGAGRHSNADVSGSKCGGVVDTVADHGNDFAARLHLLHNLLLFVRGNAGPDLVRVDTDLFGDLQCGGELVSSYLRGGTLIQLS